MSFSKHSRFRLHEFEVIPPESTIVRPDGKRSVRPTSIDVLLLLAERSGEFIQHDEIMETVFSSSADNEELLATCIAELRVCLSDTGPEPRFIESSDERGYRLLVSMVALDDYVFETDTGPIHVRPLDGPDKGDFLLHTSSGPVILHPVTDEKHGGELGWFSELKRRRVFRVVGGYAVIAWLILQIVDVLSGALPVPDWAVSTAIAALAAGFPLVAVIAWVFQVTPVGIVQHENIRQRDISVDRSRVIHHIDLVIIAVLLVAVVFLSYGRVFPTLSSDEQVRVAVLPFENLTADASDLYLSEGIADDIRSRLYEVPQLLIAARSSSRALAGKGFDINTIGERLGVQHVLEGTFRRDGNRIRLNVQLIDVDSGFNHWNKTYDTRLDNVLDLQNKISLVVASELRVVLTPELRQVLAENVTDDPVAFDFYLQARNYLDRPSSAENLERALILFAEAIEQDSLFALGYAGLCQTHIARYLRTGDTAFVGLAEANCNEALALNSDLSEAHTALGGLHLLGGKLEDAENSFRSAIDLDPRAADAYAGLGDVFRDRKDATIAEQQYLKAIELRPGNWNGYNKYARFLLQQSRLDEALDNYRRAIELAPDNAHGYNNLGVIYYFKGDFENAADNYRRSLELEPGRAAYSNTGTMYYFAGNYSEAAQMFQKAAEEAATDYRLWGNLADAQRFDAVTQDRGREAYRKAVELARSQLQVNPNDADALINLAWYYANLGDLDAARVSLNLASALSPSEAGQLYMVGLVYTILGEPDNARQAIASAVAQGFPQVIIDATPELEKDNYNNR